MSNENTNFDAQNGMNFDTTPDMNADVKEAADLSANLSETVSEVKADAETESQKLNITPDTSEYKKDTASDVRTSGEYQDLPIEQRFTNVTVRTKDNQKEKKPKFHFALKAVALLLCTAIIAAGAGYGGAYLYAKHNKDGSQTVVYQTSTEGTSVAVSGDATISEIAAKVSTSVVEITTESVVTGIFMQQAVSEGAGSGVIISSDGYIVTNNHVISGAETVTVRLTDGSEYDAAVIGSDAQTDLAVLKIDAKDLSAVTFGDSSLLNVGDFALAIGNPLGSLGGTVTNGIISALDREVTIDGQTMNLLQTNAAINPGNSGGGLFNANGELIGIVNAKSFGSDIEGLGFAIPINTAKSVIEDLMTKGYVAGRPVLGVSLVDVTDNLTAMMYRVNTLGVYVSAIEEDSAAAKAGLIVGDCITEINSTEVSSTSEIKSIISSLNVGDSVKITVVRGNDTMTLTAVLKEEIPSVSQGEAA